MLKGFLYKLKFGRGRGAVLARGAIGTFIVRVAGAGVLFGLHVMLARILGVEQYGIYVYALTWINILAILCLLGFQTSLVRFVAEYRIKQQWQLLRGILRRSNQTVLGFSIFISLTGFAVIYFFRGGLKPELATTFYIALCVLPFMAFCRLRQASLRALKHVVQSELLLCVIWPVLTGVIVIGLLLCLGDALKARYAMTANLAAIVCAAGIGAIFLHKLLPKAIGETSPDFANKQWLKVSLPLLFIAGMHIILKQTDIVMMGFFRGSADAGIYSAASRISDLVVFGLVAINKILAPMISELYHTGRTQKLQRIITLAARGIFVFTLTVSLVLAVFGKFALSLFSSEFTVAFVPLLILLCGQIVNALAGSVALIMTMTGHQNQAGAIIGISAVINIALNIFLIPLFGLVGAAISTALTVSLRNIVLLVFVQQKLGVNPTIIVYSFPSEKP